MRALKTPGMEPEVNGHHGMDTQFLSGEPESADSSELEAPETESADMSDLEPPESKPMDKPRADKKVAKDSTKPFRSQEPEARLQRKTGAAGNPEETDKSQPAPPVSPHIKPESGSMVQLPESAKEELETGSGMTIEEAMQIKCTPGTYSEHTLGSLAQMGEEGINALIWYAEGYRGRRQELREGAKLLLDAAKAA